MKPPLNRSECVENSNDETQVSPITCVEPISTIDFDRDYSSSLSVSTTTPYECNKEDTHGYLESQYISKQLTSVTCDKTDLLDSDAPRDSQLLLSINDFQNNINAAKCVTQSNTANGEHATAIHNVTKSHKPIKPGRQRLRWNLIFNLFVCLVISLPVWVPFASQYIAVILLPAIQSLFVLMWIVICILASRNMIKIFRFKNQGSNENSVEAPIHYLFVITCYKEPVDLITESVNTLAKQQNVNNITMTISFEEKTPNLEQKIQQLTKRFKSAGFARLLFTVHPYGVGDEIPGKCSNANYGFRTSVEILRTEMSYFDPENIILTTCDADSKFPPNYTTALASSFLSSNDKHATIFQGPLFYNWGLDGASFVTRVTGMIRSTLMMGALIPFNINSMSIYSYSLRLGMGGNFIHPAYQMEDIICLIRWMGITKRRIKICQIPVPVISGPTSGATVELDIIEWARQARRWTIGAAEVFHYYVVKSRQMPAFPALSWGLSFLIYHGVLWCSGALYSVSMTVSMFFISETSAIPVYVHYWMYCLAGLQQLCFLVVFILDAFATKALGLKEHICLARNILHWILSSLVLLAYSLVELYALHEVAIRGKQVCKHGAAKKDALKA